jgi:hypothetical protein
VPLDRLKSAGLAPLVAAGLLVTSCTGDGGTSADSARLPNAASLIPSAPAPQPTPTPEPTPTPSPGAVPDGEPIPGGDDSGGAGACGEPVPPPVSRIYINVHARQADRAVLDSTPLVGPDAEYCRKVGFTDGRSMCAVRPEGDPQREACEAARVGRSDTGRYGPTWSANGKPCDGPDGGASCLNHPDNQYLVFAYGAGTFRACAESGVCGEIVLP